MTHNFLYRCSTAIGHPGILVSGNNTAAEPLSDLAFTDNVVVETASGTAYREEGSFSKVANTGMSTKLADLPSPIPTIADVKLADTTILSTRDVSFVDAGMQKGLYRIHVRKSPSGTGFQQRFEYVVSGASAEVTAFTAARVASGDYLSESRVVGATAYALVLTSAPVAVPSTLAGVTLRELREGDLDASLAWLWSRVSDGKY